MWSSDAAFFLSAVVTNLKCIAAVTPDGLGMSNVQTQCWAEQNRVHKPGKLAGYYGHSKGVAGILARSELTNRTRHMVQINHLFLWAAQQQSMQLSPGPASWVTCQLLQGILEHDELPRAQQKTSSLLSGSALLGGVGSIDWINIWVNDVPIKVYEWLLMWIQRLSRERLLFFFPPSLSNDLKNDVSSL